VSVLDAGMVKNVKLNFQIVAMKRSLK